MCLHSIFRCDKDQRLAGNERILEAPLGCVATCAEQLLLRHLLLSAARCRPSKMWHWWAKCLGFSCRDPKLLSTLALKLIGIALKPFSLTVPISCSSKGVDARSWPVIVLEVSLFSLSLCARLCWFVVQHKRCGCWVSLQIMLMETPAFLYARQRRCLPSAALHSATNNTVSSLRILPP